MLHIDVTKWEFVGRWDDICSDLRMFVQMWWKFVCKEVVMWDVRKFLWVQLKISCIKCMRRMKSGGKVKNPWKSMFCILLEILTRSFFLYVASTDHGNCFVKLFGSDSLYNIGRKIFVTLGENHSLHWVENIRYIEWKAFHTLSGNIRYPFVFDKVCLVDFSNHYCYSHITNMYSTGM